MSQSNLQYLRQLSLIVSDSAGNGVDFGSFRVTFTVRRGDFQTPNSLDARIYNVTNNSANILSGKEFKTITLSAGYQPPGSSSNLGLLFQGTICQSRIGRVSQLDSYVDITAAEADQAYNFAPIFQSVAAGTPLSGLATQIQQAMAAKGITNVQSPSFTGPPLVRGRVMYGLARDEARDFAWNNNCKWSVQGETLTFIPYVGYISGGQVPTISVSTGLIGVPEQTQQGISIKILLNPQMKIGQLVKLDSQINQFRLGLDRPSQATNALLASQTQLNQQGLYYVMAANHTGDTRGEPWYTDMICLSVDAAAQNPSSATPLFATGPVPPLTPINRYGQD